MRIALRINLLLGLFYFSCTSSNTLLKFGSFGGVTGNRVEFEILDSREVWKTQSLNDTKELLGKLDNSELSEIILVTENLCLKDTVGKFGNMTYFIEVSACSKKYIWPIGDSDYSELSKVYDNISSKINE